MGPVYRAYDATRERLVAVKLFTLDLPPERAHQLVAELERLVAADLTHPALAAPLAAGISGVSAYLVQDYVAADSLDLAVREYGPAPVANALRVAAQLAGALDFAAAVQTNHGALHPRDVLLSSDETRLTGIGLTRALYRIGAVAPVRRPYTAPERVAGGEWDRRADVFSLAALMHELMWGKRVSGLGARAAQSLTEIDGTNLRQLRDVFARALAERPADRYETALAFAEALKNACPDVEVAPEPPPTAKRRTTRDDARRLPLDAAQEEQGTVAETVVGARSVPEPNLPTAPGSMPGSGVADINIPLSPVEADIVYQPVVDVRHAPPLADAVMSNSAALATAHDPEPFSAFERTRSAVWPLVLALLVGIAIGFAGGFVAGSREQPTAPT
ncbi:MAG: serine/threonine protein kinase, partial [Vicinamibacterales bacterium]